MTITKWRESVIGSGYESIDKAAGIIHGVKVIGNKSRNGRTYPTKTLQEAVPVYENSRIFLDHVVAAKNGSTGPRSIRDKWGVLKNVRVSEDGGLRADIYYLINHSQTPVLIETAERMPETFGMSHDAIGDEVSIPGGGGLKEVTKIHKVNSVDIVNDPATNSGLFESKDFSMKKTIKEIAANKTKFAKILEEIIADDPMIAEMPVDTMDMAMMDDAGEPMESSPEQQVEQAFKAALVAVIEDAKMDIPGKLAKLKTIMQASEIAMAAITGQDKTKTPPPDKAASDQDKTKTPPPDKAASDGSTEGLANEAGNLREELAATKAELQAIKTESACRQLLESSNRAVEPFRLKMLALLSEAERPALVESWSQVRKASDKPAVSKSILFEGVDELYGETGKYQPKTREEFMRAIG